MQTSSRCRLGSNQANRVVTPLVACNRPGGPSGRHQKRLKGRVCSHRRHHRCGALDSASSFCPEHKNAIVVTGSHGGLLGGKPETAIKYDVLGALYNDAGVGKDDAGVSRLPALAARGIAAAAVAAASARIGDARSTYEDGIVSRVNTRAAALGLHEGLSARDFVARLRSALAG